MRRTNRLYDGTRLAWPGLAWLGLASRCLAWREIYSEVTLTAYLPTVLRLVLVPRSFAVAPGTPVYPRSAFYRDTESQKRRRVYCHSPRRSHLLLSFCAILRAIATTNELPRRKKIILYSVPFDFKNSSWTTRNKRHFW